MKHVFFILLLVAGKLLSAQRLVWLQQTSNGSVIASTQPKPLIDPVKPTFIGIYGYAQGVGCSDTLFSHLKFHSPEYGDTEEEQVELNCFDQTDFTYKYLFQAYEWVNNSDLYPLIRVPSAFMFWHDQGNGKWELNSWRHSYVCGNDKTGYTETDRQFWQLDGQGRVKFIDQLNAKGKTQNSYDYTYTSFGNIQTSTRKDYNDDDSTRSTQHQQEWVYDNKQRHAMMIRYEGPQRKFHAKTIDQFKLVLNETLKTGQSSLRNVLDSNRVKELVVYHYGKFGLEQVTCYYNPDTYSGDIHFYSDSLFYNAAGKIIRYVGGKNRMGNSCELRYSYDKISGRLAQVTGRTYSDCADRGCEEIKVIQYFSYTNHKVSSLTEKHFEINHQYKDGKYLDATEELQEERVYTYKYKTGNQ